MKSPYEVIIEPLLTEKSSDMAAKQNKYLFCVAKDACKIDIRKAIESIYKIKVKKVNTMNMPGKSRRIRFREGMRPSWKKAIVTLKEGHKIEFT